jgi:hypothetical protein
MWHRLSISSGPAPAIQFCDEITTDTFSPTLSFGLCLSRTACSDKSKRWLRKIARSPRTQAKFTDSLNAARAETQELLSRTQAIDAKIYERVCEDRGVMIVRLSQSDQRKRKDQWKQFEIVIIEGSLDGDESVEFDHQKNSNAINGPNLIMLRPCKSRSSFMTVD